MCDTPIARNTGCVSSLKDIGQRLPLELQCSHQGQQGDVRQSLRGNYKIVHIFRAPQFLGGEEVVDELLVLFGGAEPRQWPELSGKHLALFLYHPPGAGTKRRTKKHIFVRKNSSNLCLKSNTPIFIELVQVHQL